MNSFFGIHLAQNLLILPNNPEISKHGIETQHTMYFILQGLGDYEADTGVQGRITWWWLPNVHLRLGGCVPMTALPLVVSCDKKRNHKRDDFHLSLLAVCLAGSTAKAEWKFSGAWNFNSRDATVTLVFIQLTSKFSSAFVYISLLIFTIFTRAPFYSAIPSLPLIVARSLLWRSMEPASGGVESLEVFSSKCQGQYTPHLAIDL